MKSYPIDIKPFGENAILLEWPHKVEDEILYDILDFMDFLKFQKDVDCELIPAYNSLTVICHNQSIDIEKTKGFVSRIPRFGKKGLLEKGKQFMGNTRLL